ncbi:MAG: ATP-binding protein [Sedimentisphaerales bacterium]|nr:ATP-binding protein [Sedimentisphaerales bacterium]
MVRGIALIGQLQGRPGRHGIAVDITDQVNATKQLQVLVDKLSATASRIQAILDSVPQGIMLIDEDGRILQANPIAARQLKELASIEVGRRLAMLGDRQLRELLTEGATQELRAGQRIYEMAARRVEAAGRSNQWIFLINDVTSARQLHHELEQRKRLAAIGRFASGIAHDFNNIMATIIVHARMLLDAPGLSDMDRRNLQTIVEQGQHATEVIQQILDFSRISRLQRQALDLYVVLRQEVEVLRRIMPKGIEVQYVCKEGRYMIDGDRTRLRQVFMNLALNARDAMPDGGTLSIELDKIEVGPTDLPMPQIRPGQWIRIRFSDTGRGIVPDVLPHIFEPFFTTKGPGKGSGLGLAQVHGIISQHGGLIDGATQVGKGTTFTIYLPPLGDDPDR